MNRLMDPQGVAAAVEAERAAREGSASQLSVELGGDEGLLPSTVPSSSDGIESSDGLFDDGSPSSGLPLVPGRRPVLDTPTLGPQSLRSGSMPN